MLPLWIRVNLGIMAMKGFFTFPKAPELKLHHFRQFSFISRTLVGWGFDPSAVLQLIYSTDTSWLSWRKHEWCMKLYELFLYISLVKFTVKFTTLFIRKWLQQEVFCVCNSKRILYYMWLEPEQTYCSKLQWVIGLFE